MKHDISRSCSEPDKNVDVHEVHFVNSNESGCDSNTHLTIHMKSVTSYSRWYPDVDAHGNHHIA